MQGLPAPDPQNSRVGAIASRFRGESRPIGSQDEHLRRRRKEEAHERQQRQMAEVNKHKGLKGQDKLIDFHRRQKELQAQYERQRLEAQEYLHAYTASFIEQDDGMFMAPDGSLLTRQQLPENANIVAKGDAIPAPELRVPPNAGIESRPDMRPLPNPSTQVVGDAMPVQHKAVDKNDDSQISRLREQLNGLQMPDKHTMSQEPMNNAQEVKQGAANKIDSMHRALPQRPPSSDPGELSSIDGQSSDDAQARLEQAVASAHQRIAQERQRLRNIVMESLQNLGRPIELFELSQIIKQQTGKPWASHWAPAGHGHLLSFLKSMEQDDGTVKVLLNKYVATPDMRELPKPGVSTNSSNAETGSKPIPSNLNNTSAPMSTGMNGMGNMPYNNVYPQTYGYGEQGYYPPGSHPVNHPGFTGAPQYTSYAPYYGGMYTGNQTGAYPPNYGSYGAPPQPPQFWQQSAGQTYPQQTEGQGLAALGYGADNHSNNQPGSSNISGLPNMQVRGSAHSPGRAPGGDSFDPFDLKGGEFDPFEKHARVESDGSSTTATPESDLPETTRTLTASSSGSSSMATPPPSRHPPSPPTRHGSHQLSAPTPPRQHQITVPQPRNGVMDVEAFAQRTVAQGATEDAHALTWGDFDLLFRPMLVHGFALVKHGRRGRPKRRHFWMTRDLSQMYWYTSRLVDVVMMHQNRCLYMGEVTAIREGLSTQVLRKKMLQGELNPQRDGPRCFSLIANKRTFDLQAESVAQQKVLVRAFRFLLMNR